MFAMFRSLANVIRSTVGDLKLGEFCRGSLSFFQALGNCGRQTCLKVFSSGAQVDMYNCDGSSLSLDRVSGKVPFETRNVVNPFLCKIRISSPRFSYNVGSPVKLMATCLGVCASSSFCLSTPGVAL